jgi:acyl carrier protein
MVNLPGIMPFMTELVPNVPSSPAEKSQILKQLEAAPLDERKALLIEHVRTQIAQVLRSRQPIFLSQGFFDLGMDSLTAMELRNRLQSTLNCNLSPTLAFKYSTVGALIDYLAEEVLALPAAEPGARIDETVGVKQADQTALADLSDDELEALLADELVTITKEKGE